VTLKLIYTPLCGFSTHNIIYHYATLSPYLLKFHAIIRYIVSLVATTTFLNTIWPN
jgi:hypothetical protein